ncbi:hypothetical protein [Bacillus sp. 2205SS5-2]|uniref:hypothetical protein n=1 Tax=Bacillus sp. 2205SS5-2 TaxID=3109031 RepID=UPI003006E58B
MKTFTGKVELTVSKESNQEVTRFVEEHDLQHFIEATLIVKLPGGRTITLNVEDIPFYKFQAHDEDGVEIETPQFV